MTGAAGLAWRSTGARQIRIAMFLLSEHRCPQYLIPTITTFSAPARPLREVRNNADAESSREKILSWLHSGLINAKFGTLLVNNWVEGEVRVSVFGKQQKSESSTEGVFLCQVAEDPGHIRTLTISGNQVQLLKKDKLEATWTAGEVIVERRKIQTAGALVSKQGLRFSGGAVVDLLFPNNKWAISYPDDILDRVLSALAGAGAQIL